MVAISGPNSAASLSVMARTSSGLGGGPDGPRAPGAPANPCGPGAPRGPGAGTGGGVGTAAGRSAMRISVSSWATSDRDVERSLEAMIRVARVAGA